jgi:hypothetical protein
MGGYTQGRADDGRPKFTCSACGHTWTAETNEENIRITALALDAFAREREQAIWEAAAMACETLGTVEGEPTWSCLRCDRPLDTDLQHSPRCGRRFAAALRARAATDAPPTTPLTRGADV